MFVHVLEACVWFLYPVEQNNICLFMCLHFLSYQSL